ncbi:hypothetical protein EMGBS14_06660 [Candidatus Pelagibacterales bacterium]|nr:hypothetical protein EMGBS14_06660 [Pelagibacterales bacterium]
MDKDKELSKLKKKILKFNKNFPKKIWYLQTAIKIHR